MAMSKQDIIEMAYQQLREAETPVAIGKALAWMYQTWIPAVERNVKLSPTMLANIERKQNHG